MKTINFRNQHTQNTALLLLRGIIGSVFVFHGSQKLFGGLDGFAGYLTSLGVPFPQLNALLAAGTEFFGGVALIVGLGTGFVSIPLVITMIVACYAHSAAGFDSQKGGMEYPLTLAVVTAGVGLLGAGRFSLDTVLSRHLLGNPRNPAPNGKLVTPSQSAT